MALVDSFDSENWQNVHTLVSFTTANVGKTGLQLYKTPLQDNRVSSNDIQNAPQDAEVHIIIIDIQVHLVINRKLPVQVQGDRNLYIRTQYGRALLILYMAVIFGKCGFLTGTAKRTSLLKRVSDMCKIHQNKYHTFCTLLAKVSLILLWLQKVFSAHPVPWHMWLVRTQGPTRKMPQCVTSSLLFFQWTILSKLGPRGPRFQAHFPCRSQLLNIAWRQSPHSHLQNLVSKAYIKSSIFSFYFFSSLLFQPQDKTLFWEGLHISRAGARFSLYLPLRGTVADVVSIMMTAAHLGQSTMTKSAKWALHLPVLSLAVQRWPFTKHGGHGSFPWGNISDRCFNLTADSVFTASTKRAVYCELRPAWLKQ